MRTASRIIRLSVLAAAMGALPLLGAALTGRGVARFLTMPPRPPLAAPPPFSWAAFVLLTAGTLLCLAPLVRRLLTRRAPTHVSRSPPWPFPWWGWAGLALAGAAWALAWAPSPKTAPVQPFVFFPLWAGYILVVNALQQRRTGASLMTGHPGAFAGLFAASAGFWWFFEYLNRFVGNWVYTIGADMGAARYLAAASLSFSTVLPAVLSTERLLATWPRAWLPLRGWIALDSPAPRLQSVLLLGIAAVGLAGVGALPTLLFPLLWIAPLLMVVALSVLSGESTILGGLAQGDWRPAVRMAAAGLLCGFFWEFWNVFSAAKWVYRIPYVQRFHLFEMPLLGYAGYLPFGLECALVAHWLFPSLREPAGQPAG